MEGVPIDDILIHASTIKEYDDFLNMVLQKLSKEGNTFNKRTCQFGFDKTFFWGHVVSSERVEIEPTRVNGL